MSCLGPEVKDLHSRGLLRFADWDAVTCSIVSRALRFHHVHISEVSSVTGRKFLPSTSAASVKLAISEAIVLLAATLGWGAIGGQSCALYRGQSIRSPKRARRRLLRWHTEPRRCRGAYALLLLGYDEDGKEVTVMAHRLLCYAALSCEEVKRYHTGTPEHFPFMALHSVGCGQKRNCLAIGHLKPGTAADNAADALEVARRQKQRHCANIGGGKMAVSRIIVKLRIG